MLKYFSAFIMLTLLTVFLGEITDKQLAMEKVMEALKGSFWILTTLAPHSFFSTGSVLQCFGKVLKMFFSLVSAP